MNWIAFWNWLDDLILKRIHPYFIPPVNTPPNAPQSPVSPVTPITPPTMPPTPPKYDWSTPEAARHSVRLLCDEMGLKVADKNDLCATVGAESGWQSYYLSGPKKGQPVTRENYGKDGVLASIDYGIAQINSYWHIGLHKDFPSFQYVLDNPEAVIRWMCRQWKAGNGRLWVAYQNGSYRHFL